MNSSREMNRSKVISRMNDGMKKLLAAVVSVALVGNLFAGAAGPVFKGALKTGAECRNAVCMTLAVFAGLSLLVYAFCKSRRKAVPLTRSAGTDATDWGAVSTEA